jgi:dual specificity MAP kinase phosphatase
VAITTTYVPKMIAVRHPWTGSLTISSLQYEGGEPCSVCGHVLVGSRMQHESCMPTTVIPGFLYLGTYDTASRQDLLKTLNITHILNVSRGVSGPLCSRPFLTWFAPLCRLSLPAKLCTRTHSPTIPSAQHRRSLMSASSSWVRLKPAACFFSLYGKPELTCLLQTWCRRSRIECWCTA